MHITIDPTVATDLLGDDADRYFAYLTWALLQAYPDATIEYTLVDGCIVVDPYDAHDVAYIVDLADAAYDDYLWFMPGAASRQTTGFSA